MSDYMFMLENHLNGEQSRFVSDLQAACAPEHINVFLAGGAMRDMLGGFPIRDLDFTVESNAVKMARLLAPKTGARIVAVDDLRKSVEMVLPGGSTVQLAMARNETYKKPGGKAHVVPATIHEDLRCRDFTVNAIALSLGKASRGLLMDPTNGLADLERRELRAVHSHVLYDDPVRIWRLFRFKVRLGFAIEERTLNQYRNVREAGFQELITPEAVFEQFRHIANEANPADVLRAFDEEKLLDSVSPALAGPKLNLQGFGKLFKVRQLIPFGIDLKVNNLVLFLHLLSEKLSPREMKEMHKAIGLDRGVGAALRKLPQKAKQFEKALKSARLRKASQVHEAISAEPGEVLLYLYLHTEIRLVQDRIRNYLTRYILAAAEVTDEDVAQEGLKPGTPAFRKRKAEKTAERLDARVRKPAPPVEMVAPPPPPPARRIL